MNETNNNFSLIPPQLAGCSYDKVKNYCKEINAKFTEEKHSGVCEIKTENTFLMGWKDSDRIDLERKGIDFVFDLDRISCLPNKEAGCYIKGKRIKDIEPHFFVSKVGGLESGAINFESETKSFPIMTVFASSWVKKWS